MNGFAEFFAFSGGVILVHATDDDAGRASSSSVVGWRAELAFLLAYTMDGAADIIIIISQPLHGRHGHGGVFR